MHFANFFIAGFNYYDGCMAWEELKVGAKIVQSERIENYLLRYMILATLGNQSKTLLLSLIARILTYLKEAEPKFSF